VSLGGYASFNLVDGARVRHQYRETSIRTRDGSETYAFPHHSAGPFGEDIDGEWMSADDFLRRLAFEGLGWKDIHATTEIAPHPEPEPALRRYARQMRRRQTYASLKPFIPGPFRRLVRALLGLPR
jgi:hypothetical protein